MACGQVGDDKDHSGCLASPARCCRVSQGKGNTGHLQNIDRLDLQIETKDRTKGKVTSKLRL